MSVATWATEVLPILRDKGGQCSPIEFDQIPGKVVFVPNGWGHAVLNTEPSIGMAKQIGQPASFGDSFESRHPSQA